MNVFADKIMDMVQKLGFVEKSRKHFNNIVKSLHSLENIVSRGGNAVNSLTTF